MILIMKESNFLFHKTFIAELKDTTIFLLIYFVMKIDLVILFI